MFKGSIVIEERKMEAKKERKREGSVRMCTGRHKIVKVRREKGKKKDSKYNQ